MKLPRAARPRPKSRSIHSRSISRRRSPAPTISRCPSSPRTPDRDESAGAGRRVAGPCVRSEPRNVRRAASGITRAPRRVWEPRSRSRTPAQRHREVPGNVRVMDGDHDPSARARAKDRKRARLTILHAEAVGDAVAILGRACPGYRSTPAKNFRACERSAPIRIASRFSSATSASYASTSSVARIATRRIETSCAGSSASSS